jgi:hypothetical protein
VKDQSRLGQERRKRGGAAQGSRGKKPNKSGNDSQINPTSEAYFVTDPVGPPDQDIEQVEANERAQLETSAPPSQKSHTSQNRMSQSGSKEGSPTRSNPGSTHSRATGTANSPIQIDMEDDMGSTRRLLFPSPRKDDSPKTLGEVAVNIVQTSPSYRAQKDMVAGKENSPASAFFDGNADQDDELEALFRSPMARPSTPPPKSKSSSHEPFKTPTRPTPSHRPVTRSISRSIRSAKTHSSPSQQALLQRTPSRTPRSAKGLGILPSASLRRSPRINSHAHFDDNILETPMTRTINQLLSEANHFDPSELDTSAMDLDFDSLPSMQQHPGSMLDFSNFLSTDGPMPSSPPQQILNYEYVATSAEWTDWSATQNMNGVEEDADE